MKYTLHQLFFSGFAALSAMFTLFVVGLLLSAGGRVFAQIMRSRPRPKTHPSDALPLLPREAAQAYHSPPFRRKRTLLIAAFAGALLASSLLSIAEEAIDGATRLWPTEPAQITDVGVRTDMETGEVTLYYRYEIAGEGYPGVHTIGYASPAERDAIAARYAIGDTLTVHVDPFDKDDSYINPPLISDDVDAGLLGGLALGYGIPLVGMLTIALPWLLSHRRAEASEQPPADARAIQQTLEPLTLHRAETLIWRPRRSRRGAQRGIRHVLQPLKGDEVLGVLEYNPADNHIRAVIDQEYHLHPVEVQDTVLVQFYAAAEFKTARFTIDDASGSRVATLEKTGLHQTANGVTHATILTLEGGPTYCMRGFRGFREDAPDTTILIYGRKKPPHNPNRMGDGMDQALRRPLLTLTNAAPPEHIALLMLAGFFAAGWRTVSIGQADRDDGA